MNNRFCNADYYQHVISKPDRISLSTQYSNILIINSEDRNRKQYPNSNNFIINLNKSYNDVIEIELISIDYEYSRNLYDNFNNHIYLSIDNVEYIFVIPPGKYSTIDNLVEKFNTISNSCKELQNREIDVTLGVVPSTETCYFMLNSISAETTVTLDFRGDEILLNNMSNTSYHSTSNVKLQTGVYDYKKNTNGRFLGFSENRFNNIVAVKNISKTLIPDNNDHILDIEFHDLEAFNKLYYILGIENTTIYIGNTKIPKNAIKGYHAKSDSNMSIKIRIDSTTLDSTTLDLTTLDVSNISSIYTNVIIGDLSYNLNRDHSIYLDVNDLDRLNSYNKNIDSTFAAIPVKMSNKIYFDNTKTYGTIKYFNPPKRSLDRLEISFKDKKGNILEYTGKENSIVFAVKCLNDRNTIDY